MSCFAESPTPPPPHSSPNHSPLVHVIHINNSLHLARKYARIFVRRHYLFRVVVFTNSSWDVGRTLEEFVNHSPAARDLQILLVFYQHPAWFISLQPIETCGLLLLYNNSEVKRFFHGFTGTIN